VSRKSKTIDVRVSRRILWFDREAYPLHMITRTNSVTLKAKRGLAFRTFAISVLPWFVPAIIALAVGASRVIAIPLLVGVLTLLAVKTFKLVRFLKLRLYELDIETAAGSHRALISDDRELVYDLAVRITDAINDPHAEFQLRVEKVHVGDNITMSGEHSVGKVTTP
jgi:Family of unknown function (DUF6232)